MDIHQTIRDLIREHGAARVLTGVAEVFDDMADSAQKHELNDGCKSVFVNVSNKIRRARDEYYNARVR